MMDTEKINYISEVYLLGFLFLRISEERLYYYENESLKRDSSIKKYYLFGFLKYKTEIYK